MRLCLLFGALFSVAADLVLFDDAFVNGASDYSWATVQQVTSPVHSGATALRVDTSVAQWSAFYLNMAPVSASPTAAYSGVRVWLRGAQATSINFVWVGTPSSSSTGAPTPITLTTTYQKFEFNFNVNSPTGDITGFYLGLSSQSSVFYVDDISLISNPNTAPPPPLLVNVFPDLNQRAVDRRIYGTNWADDAMLAQVNFTVNRAGGNSESSYNYLTDSHLTGQDWYYLSVQSGTAAQQANLPNSSSRCDFIRTSKARGAEPLMTVPMIGYVSKSATKRWAFSVSKYGAQQYTEFGKEGYGSADAGNGVKPDGVTLVTNNDPLDVAIAVNEVHVKNWITSLRSVFGSSANGGVKYFSLDNEPSLWSSTHRDVHPAPLSYDELWNKTLQYASAVKQVEPNATVFGPAAWGWCEYFWSAVDACGQSPTDRQAHGNVPLLQYYLTKIHQHYIDHGVKLVDYLDVHFYPQGQVSGNGIALNGATGGGLEALRMASVKELYSTTYVDPTDWITTPINLIPRMKSLISSYCPWMKFAITEYNFGYDFSGAMAQAEALAIFGREGVDVATVWSFDVTNRRKEAFNLYLNYDGLGHSIDGKSCLANVTQPDRVSAYSVLSNDGASLYVMVFQKEGTGNTVTVKINVGGRTVSGQVQHYYFDSDHTLTSLPSFTLPASGSFNLTITTISAHLIIVPFTATAPSSSQTTSAPTRTPTRLPTSAPTQRPTTRTPTRKPTSPTRASG